MKKRQIMLGILVGLAMAVCTLMVEAAGATEYSFTTYDQPFPLYTQLTSENNAVNSLGHSVAPASFDASPWYPPHSFQGFSLYDGTGYTYITSPWSGQQTTSVIINNNDQVVARIYFPTTDMVGYSGHPDAVYTGMHVGGPCGSYFWSAGSFTVIPDWDVHALDINYYGQVVGSYGNDPGGTGMAFLWDIANPNSMLHFLIPGVDNPYGSYAEGISDDGLIVGRYKLTISGPDYYFLATPVPEPGTILLLSSGLIGLIGLRKKFHS